MLRGDTRLVMRSSCVPNECLNMHLALTIRMSQEFLSIAG